MGTAWIFAIDNTIPTRVLGAIGQERMFPSGILPREARLCAVCGGIDFSLGSLDIRRKVTELRDPSRNCELCRMLWSACSTHHEVFKGDSEVWLEEYESTIRMDGVPHPILSIVKGPGNHISVQRLLSKGKKN